MDEREKKGREENLASLRKEMDRKRNEMKRNSKCYLRERAKVKKVHENMNKHLRNSIASIQFNCANTLQYWGCVCVLGCLVH